MPIWRSSELVVGRPGSSPSRRTSAWSSSSQQTPSRTSGLPALGLSQDGYEEVQQPGLEVGPGPTQPARTCQARRGTSGCSSVTSVSSWESAAVPSSGAGFTLYTVPTVAERPQSASSSLAMTPRRRASSAASASGAATYTVQYIGIANGELGILSQKQKLTPSRPSATNAAASAIDGLRRRQPRSAVAHSSAPLTSFTAGATVMSLTPPAAATPAASATATPKLPANDALAAAITPDSAERATPTDLACVSAPTESPDLASAAAAAAPLQKVPSRGASSAHGGQEVEPTSPSRVDAGLQDDPAAAAAGDSSPAADRAYPVTATVEPALLERPATAEAAPVSRSGSLNGPSASSARTSIPGGQPGPSKPPSLTSIVDDARGQVKVVTECFYSRALHSRGAPHDRHARRNRPAGPQVRDMELLNTGMPGRFGRRAPSAGGFPGWKLMAAGPGPVATGDFAVTAAEIAAGMKARGGTGSGRAGSAGAGYSAGSSGRLRTSRGGLAGEVAAGWQQNGPL